MIILKYLIYFVCIIIINSSINSEEFSFDNLDWIRDNEYNGITLYTYKNSSKITYYKAEKITKNIKAIKLYEVLIDFKNYPSLFPRTLAFEKKK